MTILSFENLLSEVKKRNLAIFQIAQEEESLLKETSVKQIRNEAKKTLDAMKNAIKNGLVSSEKSVSNWCGDDAVKLVDRYKKQGAILGPVFEKITKYSLATAEENLRMGRIVACPTAGSCGIVPSVLISVAEEKNISEEKQIDALLTAGIVGLIISYKVRLAGAVAGCQAECGVASAMAAAALAEMLGASAEEIIQAVALALKNILGEEYSITKTRGQWVEKDGIKYMPTFHPAALLRDETKKIAFWNDLKTVNQFFIQK